jgi:SAM-dependent methyltransferase
MNLTDAVWHIYRRSERPAPWERDGNLPWNDPDFSRRMLREHLDESHGAASRVSAERERQLDWLWNKLDLQPGARLLDLTCGPGLYAVPLARRGVAVTGIDFGPAAIVHARQLAAGAGVAATCHFVEADVRDYEPPSGFDAVLFLYGQLAVFSRESAQQLLRKAAAALRPGGRLAVELLEQERVDKKNSNWWYSDDTGLWGDAPFLSLGERFWYEDEKLSCERYYTLHLETGELDEIVLCDQTYAVDEMVGMMQDAGFAAVDVYPAWDGLELKDAREWNVYVARKGG